MQEKQFITVRRKDNRYIKQPDIIWLDEPSTWYNYYAKPTNKTKKCLEGLLEIFLKEGLSSSRIPAFLGLRERVSRQLDRNRTRLRRIAQRYRFRYVIYSTLNVTQLIAIHFYNKKYELLFRLKYSHLLGN